jgi:hypothetical protein
MVETTAVKLAFELAFHLPLTSNNHINSLFSFIMYWKMTIPYLNSNTNYHSSLGSSQVQRIVNSKEEMQFMITSR